MASKFTKIVPFAVLGVAAYFIYRQFFSSSGTTSTATGPVPQPGQPTLPGAAFAPEVNAPGSGPVSPYTFTSTPSLTTSGSGLVTPGVIPDANQTLRLDVVGQSYAETIPGIVAKAETWNCRKLKAMQSTYQSLSKKDKDPVTVTKAKTAVEFLKQRRAVQCPV